MKVPKVLKDNTLYKDGSGNYAKKLEPIDGLGYLPRPKFLYTEPQKFYTAISRYFPGKLNDYEATGTADKNFLNYDVKRYFSGCIGPLDVLTYVFGDESAYIDFMDALQFMTDLFNCTVTRYDMKVTKALPYIPTVYCPSVEGLYHTQDYSKNTIHGFMMNREQDDSKVQTDYKKPSMVYVDYEVKNITATKGQDCLKVDWNGDDIKFTIAGVEQKPLKFGSTDRDFIGSMGIIVLGANDEYLASWLLCKPYKDECFVPTNTNHTTSNASTFKTAIGKIEKEYHGDQRVFGTPAYWDNGTNHFNDLLKATTHTIKYHKDYNGDVYARFLYATHTSNVLS